MSYLINDIPSVRYERYNQLTASTTDQAFLQLHQDKGGIIDQIINCNCLDIYKKKNLKDDLKQELMIILFSYLERDGEKAFLEFYNNKIQFRYWLTSVAKYNFKSNTSPVYRKYISNKRLSLDFDAIPPDLSNELEDKLLLDRYEAKEMKLYLAQFLYSPKAQELFHLEEVELFLSHYFGKKNKRNFTISKLSQETDINRTTLTEIFTDLKEFLFFQLQQDKS